MLKSEARALVKQRQRRIPVDINALADDLDATVILRHDWPDNVAGKIEVGADGGYTIYVNGHHHRHRQRFTIAHEIAHIVLHQHLLGDGITTDGLYRSGFSNTVERTANRVAGNILMPRSKIRKLMASGVTSITDLARRFGVSRDAMAIQLDWPEVWQVTDTRYD